MSTTETVTQLLLAWSDGDATALDRLLPYVETELRRLASYHMQRESAGHILQTTALVNELYLKLVDQRQAKWKNRAHFFAVAAQLMRRILVDHARRQLRNKRGGGVSNLTLDEAVVISPEKSRDILSLNEALERLDKLDPLKARIVELRHFGGGDQVALRGSNGIHYLVAVNGGGGTVRCDRTAVGPWETFTLVQQ